MKNADPASRQIRELRFKPATLSHDSAFIYFTGRQGLSAQVISASIAGDFALSSDYAYELPRYGLEVGITNYAACNWRGLYLTLEPCV
ncbi:hypothetical protein QQ045_029629 [Rhodiola kirilowii]